MNPVAASVRALTGATASQPPRVVEEISRSQREAEIWVGAAQIIVIAVAALAYTFTPRGFSPDAPIAAVPLGIAALVLLIALRGWFAYSGQITYAVLAASVIAEMSVLIGILWGFAPQYETTLSVALKNALFCAIFVLIALRALRFEAIWVWLSGLTAAIGWSRADVCCVARRRSGRADHGFRRRRNQRPHRHSRGDDSHRCDPDGDGGARGGARSRSRERSRARCRRANRLMRFRVFSIAKLPTRSRRPICGPWPARA